MKIVWGCCFLFAAGLGVAAPASAIDLRVEGLTVTQATQSEDQAIPLIADRRAFVRVFVVADGENHLRPKVRLQFVYGRKVRHQVTFDAPRELPGVPTAVNRHDHGKSWNVTVPALWIKSGLKIVAEVDPDRRVRESSESNNLWPNKSGQAFDVRTAPTLKVTFVPVRLPSGRVSEITSKNTEDFISYTRRVFPLPEKLDVAVHKAISTSADVQVFDGWAQLINEIEALRLAERATDRYYAGLINPGAPAAIGGLGFLGGRSTVSNEWGRTLDDGRLTYRNFVVGHELGHNFGLPHAPCGNPGGPDPLYPYPEANIGRHGFDVFLNRAYDPAAGGVDLMSYCRTEPWISDYNYIKVMNRRGRATGRSEAATGAVENAGDALLVWGRETANGWVLEPAFRVQGVTPRLEDTGAAITLVDAQGRVRARHAVWLEELDHGPGRVFAALVPVESNLASLRLEVEGRVVAERRAARVEAGGRFAAAPRAFRTDDETVLVAWDADAQPVALLRDADSGEVLGFARGGRLELATRAERIEVLLSNGVDSVKRDFDVP